MSDDVMRLPQKLKLTIAANHTKIRICKRDNALRIGFGNDIALLIEFDFLINRSRSLHF